MKRLFLLAAAFALAATVAPAHATYIGQPVDCAIWGGNYSCSPSSATGTDPGSEFIIKARALNLQGIFPQYQYTPPFSDHTPVIEIDLTATSLKITWVASPDFLSGYVARDGAGGCSTNCPLSGIFISGLVGVSDAFASTASTVRNFSDGSIYLRPARDPATGECYFYACAPSLSVSFLNLIWEPNKFAEVNFVFAGPGGDDPSKVPEPPTVALLLAGLLGMAALRRRFRMS